MTLREKLRQLLAEQGYSVDGVITGAQGWYRRTEADCVRWETTATVEGRKVTLMSYSTMSACVRYGIRIEPSGSGWDFEVTAFRPVKS